MPGGGKSTIGRHLARRLGTGFVDTDTVIERRLGCPIRTYFEREGEAPFRDIEAAVLAEMLGGESGVVATGGGIVLRAENRGRLQAQSTCVYLRSTPDELIRRLRHDAKRPLLQVADPLARLRELHADRDPLYREAAHFIVETGRPSVATLVNMILMQLELAGAVDPARSATPADGFPPASRRD
jgi:shikimate kinase